MRRQIFYIGSILLILFIALGVLGSTCPGPTGCTVDVKATLDGSSWSGNVSYKLTGPGATTPTVINGTSVPNTHSNVNSGNWTCTYVSGGPAGASFVNITPSAMQNVSAGVTITFTLNFVTPAAVLLDHFKCYHIEQGASVNRDVQLEDQFGSVEAKVEYANFFCNPAKKTYDGEVTEIKNSDNHLTLYGLTGVTGQKRVVEVNNQFGKQTLHVSDPVMLAVPTKKEGHNEPVGLDHYLVYNATGSFLNVVVQLEDQFHDEPEVMVVEPVFFANPVQKTTDDGDVTLIENPDEHLVFYGIQTQYFETDVNIANQFGEATLKLRKADLLAVPSQKISYGPPPPLDHFKFYEVVSGPDANLVLPRVKDQFYFGVEEVQVNSLKYFGNPVAKTYDGVLTSIGNPDLHLSLYSITTPTVQNWVVEVDNQFGTQELTVSGPVMLAVPTMKEGHNWPVWCDHYLLYKVTNGVDLQVTVDLEDQWHKESDVEVRRPVYFANPAAKTPPRVDWSPSDPLTIENPDEHLVFYEIIGESYQGNVGILNQFFPEPEQETISVSDPELLAVPSEKISYEPVEPEPVALDHFMCYWVGEDMVLPEWPGVVYLEDQFCAVEAEVSSPWGFFNPVEKWHDGVTTPISNPDHHLLAYDIYYQEGPQWWQVEINNQFGVQTLTVYGPVALAVPTQKIEPIYHEPPVGLDHFMLYEVIEGPPVNVGVALNDQFGDQPEVEVGYPDYFFIPVRKTHGDMVWEIQSPDEHLVSYEIWGEIFYQQVQVVNQFGGHIFPNVEGPYCLTVPSEKLSAGQLPPQQ